MKYHSVSRVRWYHGSSELLLLHLFFSPLLSAVSLYLMPPPFALQRCCSDGEFSGALSGFSFPGVIVKVILLLIHYALFHFDFSPFQLCLDEGARATIISAYASVFVQFRLRPYKTMQQPDHSW